jgi:hypothetical protein
MLSRREAVNDTTGVTHRLLRGTAHERAGGVGPWIKPSAPLAGILPGVEPGDSFQDEVGRAYRAP